MRFIYCLLTGILFVAISASAQSNFKHGYVIKNNNDSIVGLVDFRTDGVNSTVCRFKSSDTDAEQLFYPGDIAKYRFINEGKYYVSREVEIDSVTRRVFLEYLVQGMMDLYYYYYDDKIRQDYYFFENSDGKMISITMVPDPIVNTKRIKSDEKYKGVLVYLFQDYPAITKDMKNITFVREDMINITKEYHNLVCTTGEDCVEFENDYKKKYIDVKFSAYAGVYYMDYGFEQKILKLYDSPTFVSPAIGAQMSVVNPRWSKSVSFVADVSFSGLKWEKERTDALKWHYDYEFKAILAQVKAGIKYTYLSRKVRPVAELGLGFAHMFGKSKTLYVTQNGVPVDDKYIDYDAHNPASFFKGFNGGIGFDYMLNEKNSIICRLTFERLTSDDRLKMYQLKMGYSF